MQCIFKKFICDCRHMVQHIKFPLAINMVSVHVCVCAGQLCQSCLVIAVISLDLIIRWTRVFCVRAAGGVVVTRRLQDCIYVWVGCGGGGRDHWL